MLCRNFELIPIKIGFIMNFKSCSKSRMLLQGLSAHEGCFLAHLACFVGNPDSIKTSICIRKCNNNWE